MTSIEIPKFMAHRPVDEKRGLPVPFMNTANDGSFDFITVKEERRREAARKGLCGICGKKLKFLSAFVGGPRSAESHWYSNPPYHPECAEWGVMVCPYIFIERHGRVSDRRAYAFGAVEPVHMTLDKPTEWVLGVARTQDTKLQLTGPGPIRYLEAFVAGPWVRNTTYGYVDGKLTKRVG
jgi:hypothetical protein